MSKSSDFAIPAYPRAKIAPKNDIYINHNVSVLQRNRVGWFVNFSDNGAAESETEPIPSPSQLEDRFTSVRSASKLLLKLSRIFEFKKRGPRRQALFQFVARFGFTPGLGKG